MNFKAFNVRFNLLFNNTTEAKHVKCIKISKPLLPYMKIKRTYTAKSKFLGFFYSIISAV